jgi:hypothetical protein
VHQPVADGYDASSCKAEGETMVRTIITRAMLIPVVLFGLAGLVGGVWLLAHPIEGISIFDGVFLIVACGLLLSIVVIAWSLPYEGKSRQRAR